MDAGRRADLPWAGPKKPIVTRIDPSLKGRWLEQMAERPADRLG
jgi:hypothetical protein